MLPLGLARVGSLDVSLLRPARPRAREDVHRAGLRNGAIILVPVRALCRAGFVVRRDRKRVAILTEAAGIAKLVALPRIRSLEVSLLRPIRTRANEDVDRARSIQRIVLLIAVHPLPFAALKSTPHPHP